MTERSDIVLRSYESRDLDAIVELDAECFDPPFRFSKTAMRRFAEAENAWVVVAVAEGALAGFCIVHMEQAESLDAAVRFYERLAYKRVGAQRGFYGPGIDAAMYWKEFSET